MQHIKDIISSLFIYSNRKDKDINSTIYENDKSNENNISGHLPDVKQQNEINSLPLINQRAYHIQKKSVNNNINYITRNLRLLREQEARIRELRNSKEKPKTREYSNRAYLHISSRLMEVKQPEKEQIKKEMKRYDSASPNKRNDNNINKEKRLKKLEQQHPRVMQSNEIQNINQLSQCLHKDYGKTPEYLIKKKEEYQEQKEYEKQRKKEKLILKGMRIVPEQERLGKLNELSERKKSLEEELNQMPIARISMKLQQRKREIEELLRGIDIENTKYSFKTVLLPIQEQ